jgi:outer membrane lipoprotein SlyB
MKCQDLRLLLLPLLLAVGVAACDSGAVNPGYVNTAASTARAAGPVPGGTGRVVAINETALRGSGGGGSGRGPLVGGLIGGAGGAAIGAATSNSLGGGIVGGVLGAIGGAIAGAILESHGNPASAGPGIEVTVERDDGQKVTVAQRDDGDIQLGDRVMIVQDRSGVARVVRDTSRRPDRTASSAPPPQSASPPNGPPAGRSVSSSDNPRPQDDPRYGNLN